MWMQTSNVCCYADHADHAADAADAAGVRDAMDRLILEVDKMARQGDKHSGQNMGGECCGAGGGAGGPAGGGATLRTLAQVLGELLNKQAEVAQAAAEGLTSDSPQGDVLNATAEAAVLSFMATQFGGAMQNAAEAFKAVAQKA
jgi:hypothetical protein